MRSATLLAFVDWRPSAVKRTILVSAAGCGLALEPPLGASLGDGSEAALCRSHASTARPRAALPAPRQALYPTFSAAWAATSGFVLAGGPSSRVVGCYEGPRTPCFGRILGINPS